MKRSNRLILLIGVFLAIVAFVGIVMLMQSNARQQTAQPTAPQELPTVFATRDITLGTKITQDMLVERQVAVTSRSEAAFQDDSLVLGKIARKDIAAEKQLTADDFDVTGAPVTIDTPAGQRAMALQVDQISGVGTLLRAGDYVDLVVAFNLPVIATDPDTGEQTGEASAVSEYTSKLLLQGIQVLGTLLPPPPPPAEGAPAEEEPGTALTGQQEILILSLDAQQTEVLKLAQLSGSITAVLRSPLDFRDPTTQDPIVPAPAVTTGITLRVLVDQYDVLIPEILEATFDGEVSPPEPTPTPDPDENPEESPAP